MELASLKVRRIYFMQFNNNNYTYSKSYYLPDIRAPPNGCCATTDPVDLSLM